MRIRGSHQTQPTRAKANIRENLSLAETGPYRCRVYSIAPPSKKHPAEAYTLVLDTTDSPFETDDDVPSAPVIATFDAETADELVSQVTAVGWKYQISKSSIWGTLEVDDCINALIGTARIALH